MLSVLLIAILSAALIAAPATATPASGPSAPLGVVLVAKKAHDEPDLIYSGATIYDGERLETTEEGALLAQLGSGHMVLRQNSSAIMHSVPNGFSMELEKGTVVVFSGKHGSFQVVADDAVIRPLNAQPALAQITKNGTTKLVLTCTRGTLEVSISREVKIIEAGTSYEMEAQAGESGGAPQPSGTQPAAHSHFVQVFVLAIGIATVFVIIRALESRDRL